MKACTERGWLGWAGVALAWLGFAGAAHADDELESQRIVGIGIQRMPAWPGSDNQRNEPVPFILAELPCHITISTLDGLTVDFIHADGWHGGIYGNYQWGRDRSELGSELEGTIPSFSPRISAGGYVEYEFADKFEVGSDLSHDTQGAGAYLRVYGSYELPSIGYWMHEVELQWQAMNGPAMRRYFGVTPAQAMQLGVDSWQPTGGTQQMELEYSAFMPTSLHTGFAFMLNYARLLGQSSGSPLVHRYGSSNQFTGTLAFVYRFL
ncbi:MipA/OmpV family protein [Dyella sp. C9]|uniref:MipA/OmpV family protein n=1 Tax=Dyella sp. C9 TaxID=2202154 RepID=UPI000DF00E8A|nr:MipA/OmpV family protein [Dyella sp. C9]